MDGEQVIRLEERLKAVERRMESIGSEVSNLSKAISQLGERIAMLEAKVCANYNGFKVTLGLLKDIVIIMLMAMIGVRGFI